MSTVQQLVSRKGGGLASLPPDTTVLQAAQLMNERHIGSVVVLEGDQLVGIFTERDVMRRVVAAQLDPAKTILKDVMTTQVACATSQTTLDELRIVMRDKRIRHIPIINEHSHLVLGMISIGDLNKASQEVQDQTIRYLQQYMSVA